jgi:hypothetical protein
LKKKKAQTSDQRFNFNVILKIIVGEVWEEILEQLTHKRKLG